MEFWTALVITYGMASPFYGEQSVVALPNHEACSALIEPTSMALMEIDPAIVVQCIETTQPSKSIRPRQRPDDLAG